MMEKNKKELLCYLVIFIGLMILVLLNNMFWKIGKQSNTTNNIVYLESNNVIYDVPYEEKALD